MKIGKLLSCILLSSSIIGGAQAATAIYTPGVGINAGIGDVFESTFTFPAELIWEFTTTIAVNIEFTTYDVDATTNASRDGSLAGLRTSAGVRIATDATSSNSPADGRLPGGECFTLRPTGSTRAGNQLSSGSRAPVFV